MITRLVRQIPMSGQARRDARDEALRDFAEMMLAAGLVKETFHNDTLTLSDFPPLDGWPYIHRDGHLRARIIEETAEAVSIEYRTTWDRGGAGVVPLSKEEFRNSYGHASPNTATECAKYLAGHVQRNGWERFTWRGTVKLDGEGEERFAVEVHLTPLPHPEEAK